MCGLAVIKGLAFGAPLLQQSPMNYGLCVRARTGIRVRAYVWCSFVTHFPEVTEMRISGIFSA